MSFKNRNIADLSEMKSVADIQRVTNEALMPSSVSNAAHLTKVGPIYGDFKPVTDFSHRTAATEQQIWGEVVV